jgi:3-oxoacyl-(acyl-carrier-protein) synthase
VAGLDRSRTGLIAGNLSFPSESFTRLAEAVWRGHPARIDPRNRFMSGLPILLAAQAQELGGPAFALDAACASSLYAIKLACDALHDGRADLMLAGAVQGADDLFLHIGFCALSALSRSGRSRPFHRGADGLVPAEGAAFVALKRLADARRDGDTIHGVIRGVGLSNDGRGKGLLAPAEEGQQRAMRDAYAQAGFGPERVSLVECHATGTPVGDATELRSTGAVYAGLTGVPLGAGSDARSPAPAHAARRRAERRAGRLALPAADAARAVGEQRPAHRRRLGLRLRRQQRPPAGLRRRPRIGVRSGGWDLRRR